MICIYAMFPIECHYRYATPMRARLASECDVYIVEYDYVCTSVEIQMSVDNHCTLYLRLASNKRALHQYARRVRSELSHIGKETSGMRYTIVVINESSKYSTDRVKMNSIVRLTHNQMVPVNVILFRKCDSDIYLAMHGLCSDVCKYVIRCVFSIFSVTRHIMLVTRSDTSGAADPTNLVAELHLPDDAIGSNKITDATERAEYGEDPNRDIGDVSYDLMRHLSGALDIVMWLIRTKALRPCDSIVGDDICYAIKLWTYCICKINIYLEFRIIAGFEIVVLYINKVTMLSVDIPFRNLNDAYRGKDNRYERKARRF